MLVILKLSIFLSSFVFVLPLQCFDENNDPVDWFIAYKIPEIKESNNKLIKKGLGYIYLTFDNYNGWKLSDKSLNASNSLIGLTLTPLYTNASQFLVYNDQPPNGASKSAKGHNKGVVSFNSEGGFWLVHSVPHFPPLNRYNFPESGTIYGQTFLCLSLNLKNLNEVGIQLKYNEPQIYSVRIDDTSFSNLSDLIEASNNVIIRKSPWFRQTQLKTAQSGTVFQSFAKSGRFLKDLYEDWLAPTLRSNLLVESWLNGPGKLPSNCTKPYEVHNIDSLSIKSVNANFTRTRDHSKWAITQHNTIVNWICIGDINRMHHQLFRGGGTVCLNNNLIVNNYRKMVSSIEECQRYGDNEFINLQ